jgi:hypothetical protein
VNHIKVHVNIKCTAGIGLRLNDQFEKPPAMRRQALAERGLPPGQFRSLQFGEPVSI